MFRRIGRTNGRPARATRALLAIAAALPLAVLSPSAGTAQADDPQDDTRGPTALLSCSTGTDGWTGWADCANPSSQVVAFRAVVVCGWWPDAYGHWVTLEPGWSGHSSATCGGGTGVGSVSWEEG
ncbi:hypothetical protein [Streptomyces sp. NPDC001970]